MHEIYFSPIISFLDKIPIVKSLATEMASANVAWFVLRIRVSCGSFVGFW
jgi:hypothetical protein